MPANSGHTELRDSLAERLAIAPAEHHELDFRAAQDAGDRAIAAALEAFTMSNKEAVPQRVKEAAEMEQKATERAEKDQAALDGAKNRYERLMVKESQANEKLRGYF